MQKGLSNGSPFCYTEVKEEEIKMAETKTINSVKELPFVKKFDKKANELSNKVIEAAESHDRAAHWRAVHDLLRHLNKKARKEQDATAKDCKAFRDAKVIKKDKSKIMGLRWGVSLPPMTYNALIEADIIAFGKSDLKDYDKEADDAGITGSNGIVRDLEKALPMYKVS